MIKMVNGALFVKDVPPVRGDIFIELKAAQSSCRKDGKSAIINITPKGYLNRGLFSKGDYFTDLFSFISDTMEKIRSEIFFDSRTTEGNSDARDILSRMGDINKRMGGDTGVILERNRCLANVVMPFENFVKDAGTMEYIDENQFFNVNIEDFNMTFGEPMFDDYTDWASKLALLISTNDYRYSFTAESDSAGAYITTSPIVNLKYSELVSILMIVFNYCSFQDVRDVKLAFGMSIIKDVLKWGTPVNLWSRAVNRYVGPRYKFKSSLLSKEITKDYGFVDATYVNACDISGLVCKNNNTEVPVISTRTGLDNRTSTCAAGLNISVFAGATNPKSGSSEIVGVDLRVVHKDIVARAFIEGRYTDPLEDAYRKLVKGLNRASCVTYEDMDSMCELYKALKNDNFYVLTELLIATKSGGQNVYDCTELKTKKLPPVRRDLIMKCICEACYDLEVRPELMLKKMDVDFKNLYKAPTPFSDNN